LDGFGEEMVGSSFAGRVSGGDRGNGGISPQSKQR
jgi:hypothetical protein